MSALLNRLDERSARYFSERLRATFANGLNSELYKCDPPWVEVARHLDPTLLPDLPLLSKSVYRTRIEGAVEPMDVLVQHTKGTTGEITFRFRSSRDAQFLATFFAAMDADWQGTRRPLLLQEMDGSHGGGLALPSKAVILSTSPEPSGIERAVHILTRRFSISGAEDHVTFLSGRLRFLILLTATLHARQIKPSSLGVHRLFTYGSYLSARWRAWLQESWGIEIEDTYSLSEIFGSATRCPACGTYRFLPSVYAEFLHPVSGTEVEHGIAVPVLTELFPFVTHEPFIRYWTDDLVLLTPNECCGPAAFLIKGRSASAVWDSSVSPARLLLPWTELQEVLERVGGLAWELDPLDWSTRDEKVRHYLATQPLGRPLVRIVVDHQQEPALVTLTLACRGDLHGPALADVAWGVRGELLRASSALAALVRRGTFTFQVEALPQSRFAMDGDARRLHDTVGT